MKYAIAFFFWALFWLVLAWSRGGWYWLLVWPAISSAVVGWAYATRNPAVLGKRPDGSIRPVALVLLLPYFLLTWAVWHVFRLVSREKAAHEVAPGVFVGRLPFERDLPTDTRLVIDLTGEFVPRRGVRAGSAGRAYVCVPTLDGSAPSESALAHVLERIEACGFNHGGNGGGSVYIHCAQGRGRSAAVAAAVLIARGIATDVAGAERIMVGARPMIRLNAAQRAWVERVTSRAKPGELEA
jgi:hypothetical protein